jgi:hypothetical protein
MSKWQTDGTGNVIVYPITGYETASFLQSVAVLRIEYARSEEDLQTGGTAIQFVISPKIARDLAASLLDLADRTSQPPPAGTPRN